MFYRLTLVYQSFRILFWQDKLFLQAIRSIETSLTPLQGVTKLDGHQEKNVDPES